MAVYKRGNKGVFYMNFTVNGERVCKSTGKFTKKEAKLIEAVEKKRLMENASLSPREKRARMMYSEAIKKVFNERWKHNKDGEGSYRNAEILMELIGDMQISRIDEDVVSYLVTALEAKRRSPATINRYLAALKTVMRHHKQPWDHIKLKKEPEGRIRILSTNEEQMAIDLLRTPRGTANHYFDEMADLVEVLIDTGMRLSEGLNLEPEDINFKSNVISIWFNKSKKPRSIPMTKRVVRVLQKRLEQDQRPFTITVNQAEYAWNHIRKQMGLQHDKQFIIHALRHTCASRLVNGNIDLYVVMKWLGHSSVLVTQRYAHLNPKKLHEAVEVLEPI